MDPFTRDAFQNWHNDRREGLKIKRRNPPSANDKLSRATVAVCRECHVMYYISSIYIGLDDEDLRTVRLSPSPAPLKSSTMLSPSSAPLERAMLSPSSAPLESTVLSPSSAPQESNRRSLDLQLRLVPTWSCT